MILSTVHTLLMNLVQSPRTRLLTPLAETRVILNSGMKPNIVKSIKLYNQRVLQ